MSNNKPKCIVVGLGQHGVKLFSNKLKERIEFIPNEYSDLTAVCPINEMNFGMILDNIEKDRKLFKSDKVIVLGYSFAGMVALQYAAKYRENTSAVINICSPPCWTTSYKKFVQEFMEKDLSESKKEILRKNKERFYLERANIRKEDQFVKFTVVQAPLYWKNPYYDESSFWENISVNLDLMCHLDSVVYREYDPNNVMSDLDIPVLSMFGRYDYATPYNAWDKYPTPFRNVTKGVFDNSAHHPMVEESDKFDKLILEWCKEVFADSRVI